jgi:hypothetical protein
MNPTHDNRRQRPCPGSRCALLLPLLLVGCGGGDRRYEIQETRVVRHRGEQLNAPDWQRFRFRRRDPAKHPGQMKPKFTYALPAGWKQLPPRMFRDVNLKVGDVECYVSTVTGGGLAANTKRWREQMGLEPYSTAELQKLPRRKVLGREGVRVECAGTFSAMEGPAKPGFKLHALYVQFPAFAVSVKMIGPEAGVNAAREAFEQFVDSLKIDMSSASREKDPTPPKGSFDRSKLRWDVPSGWKAAGGSSMRIVTVKIAAKADGVIDNINRWRQEMQKPPLSAQDVDRLPRIEVLGEQAPLLEEDGSYQGMGGPRLEKGMLFGVVCPLEDVTLFIKMVGGPEDMRAAKNDFLKFCASLRMES